MGDFIAGAAVIGSLVALVLAVVWFLVMSGWVPPALGPFVFGGLTAGVGVIIVWWFVIERHGR